MKKENIGRLCMPKNLEMVQCENKDYPDMFMIVNYDEKKDTYNISYRQKTIFEIKSKNINIEPDTNDPSQFPADGNDTVDYK